MRDADKRIEETFNKMLEEHLGDNNEEEKNEESQRERWEDVGMHLVDYPDTHFISDD